MRLHVKILVVMMALTFCSIAVVTLFASTSIMDGIISLESEFVGEHAQHISSMLEYEISGLEAIAKDWAYWDDTYVFVQNNNSRYIETNLIDETFIDLKLNFMLFFNSSGYLVFGKALNIRYEVDGALLKNLMEHFNVSSPLINHKTTENVMSGLIKLSDNLALFVSCPILTSSNEGPIMGAPSDWTLP